MEIRRTMRAVAVAGATSVATVALLVSPVDAASAHRSAAAQYRPGPLPTTTAPSTLPSAVEGTGVRDRALVTTGAEVLDLAGTGAAIALTGIGLVLVRRRYEERSA